MPKLRKSVEDRANDSLRAGIKAGLIMEMGTDKYERLAPIIGRERTTVYARIRDPDSFQLGELRRAANTLHWSNSQILAIFGRTEGGEKSA